MEKLRRTWQKTPKKIRQTIIFIIGWVVVLVGIIDLPLPGPGWVIIFLGFAILATEFAHAKRTRDWMVHVLKKITDWFQQQWQALTKKKR